MKVKFANKIFEVLYTKNVAGQTMYAVEDEPNHIDWLVNVEVVNAKKKELKKIEPIADEWIEDYWKHHKVTNPDSYNGGEEIQFDHDGFVRFCQTHCSKFAWSEEDERICHCLIKDQKEGLDKVNNSESGHTEIISELKEMYRERINWLKSLKERVKGE